MTALTEFLFPAPARRTTLGIIKWWEKRRLAYNLMVGAAGTFTITLVALTEWILGTPEALPPWQAVVVFGLGANVFYCLGPFIEWSVEKLFRGEVLPIGPGLYRMGLTFAVGLALFPSLLVTISFLVRLFFVS